MPTNQQKKAGNTQKTVVFEYQSEKSDTPASSSCIDDMRETSEDGKNSSDQRILRKQRKIISKNEKKRY